MPEIEQSALDALTAKAGEIDGLKTEVTTLKGQVTDVGVITTERNELKTEKATFVASQTELENKLNSATGQVTTLTAQVEGNTEQAIKLIEAETKIKELTDQAQGLTTKIETGLKERLIASGLTAETLEGKDSVILEAMEVAANASRTASSALTGKDAGLGGAGGGIESKPTTTLDQAAAEMEMMRKTPSMQGPSSGNIQE